MHPLRCCFPNFFRDAGLPATIIRRQRAPDLAARNGIAAEDKRRSRGALRLQWSAGEARLAIRMDLVEGGGGWPERARYSRAISNVASWLSIQKGAFVSGSVARLPRRPETGGFKVTNPERPRANVLRRKFRSLVRK